MFSQTIFNPYFSNELVAVNTNYPTVAEYMILVQIFRFSNKQFGDLMNYWNIFLPENCNLKLKEGYLSFNKCRSIEELLQVQEIPKNEIINKSIEEVNKG